VYDGYTDLLPLWQAEFGLGYAGIGSYAALTSAPGPGSSYPINGCPARERIGEFTEPPSRFALRKGAHRMTNANDPCVAAAQ
jgi:hypothetical protein